MKKRITSLVLAMVMVVVMLPTISLRAAAAETSSTAIMGEHGGRVIKADGSLWGWSIGDPDELKEGGSYLGNGSAYGSLTPIKIMDDVSQVFVYYNTTFVIKTDGSLWGWGENTYGIIGDGTTETRLNPVKIMDGVSSVVATQYMTLAVKTDGSLWTWGKGGWGRIGDGTDENRLSPVKIMDGVVSVSSDGTTSMAIKTDGTLWGWGSNSSGQVGDGTTEDRLSPVKIMDDVATVSVETYRTMAIKTDGTLWGWGSNTYGQVGDGTSDNCLSPVKIMENVSSVTPLAYSTAAVKTDGTLWAWGSIGGSTTEDSLTPVKTMEGVSSVFNGMAVKTDGSLWYWGSNSKIMEGVAYASSYNSRYMAIKTDGSLWTWGENGFNGNLGDGTTEDHDSPVKILDGVKIPTTSTASTETTTSSTTDTSTIKVTLDGNVITFDQEPVMEDGRTLVPMRAIFEAMGATVEWDQTTQTVTGTKGDTVIKMTIGSTVMTKNGQSITLDVAPKIVGGRTLVPVRAVAESFDADVEWNGDTQTVIISTAM